MKTLENYVTEAVATYRRTNLIERLVVDKIFIPFCQQLNIDRKPVNGSDQFDDIDSIINGKKIQEKSGITYSEWVLLEVYNDINPLNPRAKLEGWGLITKADYHIYIYRGTKDIAIDWNKVYIAKYESSKIREMCERATESDEFIKEVARIKELIKIGDFDPSKYQSKKIKIGNTTAFINCNASEKKKDPDSIKYAITIKVHRSNLGDKQSLYKYDNKQFIKQ